MFLVSIWFNTFPSSIQTGEVFTSLSLSSQFKQTKQNLFLFWWLCSYLWSSIDIYLFWSMSNSKRDPAQIYVVSTYLIDHWKWLVKHSILGPKQPAPQNSKSASTFVHKCSLAWYGYMWVGKSGIFALGLAPTCPYQFEGPRIGKVGGGRKKPW